MEPCLGPLNNALCGEMTPYGVKSRTALVELGVRPPESRLPVAGEGQAGGIVFNPLLWTMLSGKMLTTGLDFRCKQFTWLRKPTNVKH